MIHCLKYVSVCAGVRENVCHFEILQYDEEKVHNE